MTQEDFGDVSSRTYVSSLERAEKSPTIDKVVELATAMKVHPLTLFVLTWGSAPDTDSLLKTVLGEVAEIQRGRD